MKKNDLKQALEAVEIALEYFHLLLTIVIKKADLLIALPGIMKKPFNILEQASHF